MSCPSRAATLPSPVHNVLDRKPRGLSDLNIAAEELHIRHADYFATVTEDLLTGAFARKTAVMLVWAVRGWRKKTFRPC